MKIIVYCQHVLGIGHFFRTLEICRALKRHEVLLVTGGPRVDAAVPAQVRMVRLPGLQMNREFQGLHPTAPGKSVGQVKTERQEKLFSLFEKERPDIFLVELYPFGRKAFRFEIDPVLKGIRDKTLPPARVICSLRDILVERGTDAPKYEARIIETLNGYFDGLLVHADPGFIRLDETFSRMDDITVPVAYTGFIAPTPPSGARDRMRQQLGLRADEQLIVASAGGGKVGDRLLTSVLDALPLMARKDRACLHVFTGPYLDQPVFDHLKTIAGPRVRIERFSKDFLSYLAAADLSVSMAGYNTTMNILSTRVPALVWPFPLNQEQGLRARRLAELKALTLIDEIDLRPDRLAALMDRNLSKHPEPGLHLDLDGAESTARRLEKAMSGTGSF